MFDVVGDPGCSTCLGFGIIKDQYKNGGGYNGRTYICRCAIIGLCDTTHNNDQYDETTKYFRDLRI